MLTVCKSNVALRAHTCKYINVKRQNTHKNSTCKNMLIPRVMFIKETHRKLITCKCNSSKELNVKKDTIRKIKKDCLIDIGIAMFNIYATTDIVTSISILSGSLCNDIYINLVTNNGHENFFKRMVTLFKLGLCTNLIGAYIYTSTLYMFIKYVLVCATSIAIISNMRFNIVNKLPNSDHILLRLCNNYLGYLQHYICIKLFIC